MALPLTSKLSPSRKIAWSVATARVFPSSAICLAPPSLPTCPLTPNREARSTARACSKPNGACFDRDEPVAPPATPFEASNPARATAQRLTLIGEYVCVVEAEKEAGGEIKIESTSAVGRDEWGGKMGGRDCEVLPLISTTIFAASCRCCI